MRAIDCTALVKHKEAIGLGVGDLLLVGATALLLSFGLTPLWQNIAPRLGVLEEPGPRRIHRVPTPTSGGLVVYLSFWVALLLHGSISHALSTGRPLMLASTVIVVLGLIDDLYDLRPGIKLLGQIAAAATLVLATSLATPAAFSFAPFPGSLLWGGLFAVGWLVAMTNILNIIDGLDGLASGLAAIAALSLLMLSFQQGQSQAALFAATLIGAGVGFLRYNVSPARLFLGDAGGMFLGFMLGFVSLQGALGGPQAVAPAVPLLIVGVPLLDTFYAVVRRAAAGQPIAKADAKHIHHQLLRHGLETSRAVLLLYGIAATMAVVALGLAGSNPWLSWAALGLFGLTTLPWARRLGVLGDLMSSPRQAAGGRTVETRIPRLVASDSVDFHEETGKFRGIAK